MVRKSSKASNQEPTGALSKAGKIIDVLADNNGIGPAEVAAASGIPRSSAYRILDGLVQVGLVKANQDDTYSLSLSWLNLSDVARSSLTEWPNAYELLAELTTLTGQTTFLTVISGFETVCVECAQGPSIDALILRPGGTLPFFAGAAGRVCLAYSDEQIQNDYLKQAPFAGYNENSLVTASALRTDIKQIRERGFAISNEDITIGVASIGVPIFSQQDGIVVGALSTGGFADAMMPRCEELAGQLTAYVDRLGSGQLSENSSHSQA